MGICLFGRFRLGGMFCRGIVLGVGATVSKVSSSAALGGGDVLLLAACCLFVGAGNLDCYVLFVALMGIALALVWLFAKKSKTFPFAPALVWPCWLLLVL